MVDLESAIALRYTKRIENLKILSISTKIQTYHYLPGYVKIPSEMAHQVDQSHPIPGQRLEMVARFPNQLYVCEILGPISEQQIVIGLPTFRFVSDGNLQYEYREPDSVPDVSPAAATFEEMRTQHGLPEFLRLQQLLSNSILDVFAKIPRGLGDEYTIIDGLVHCRYELQSAVVPSSLVVSSLSSKSVTPFLRLEFTDWVVNPTVEDERFVADLACQ